MVKLMNPFDPIYEQLNRLESMIVDLRQDLNNEKEEPLNNWGMEMAMRVTGYSRNTLYKLVNKRQIPHYKHRGKLRFEEETLKEWSKGKARPISSSTASRYSR